MRDSIASYEGAEGLHTATILVVDDTEATRYVVRHHLTQANYAVLEATTEAEALQVISMGVPDLVVLDVVLPDGNGLELCRRLRSKPATALLPIIQVSATFTRGEDYARGLDSGADSYLVQPFDPPVLLATVRSLLRARKAEAAQSRLAAIVENADEAILSQDLTGRITSWNCAAEGLFGFSRDEALGKSVGFIIPPDLEMQEKGFLAKLARGERIQQLETVRITREGRRVDVLVTTSPIRDDAGRITGASSILRDITRRKQAEQALRASEARLKTILENLHEGLIVINSEGTVLRWNRMALDMHGYCAQEEHLTSWSKLVELYELSTPEGAPVPVDQWPVPRLLREGSLRNYELKVKHKLKDWERIFSYGGVMLPAGPTAEAMGLLTIRDITESQRNEQSLKRAEGRLDRIISSAMDAVISIGADQRVVLFNPAAERLFGIPAVQARGRHINDFIPAKFRPAHTEHVKRFGHTGVTSRKMGHLGALSGLRSNGEEFPIEASISHSEIAGEQLYTVILRDISDRKRAEEALQRQAALIELTPTAMLVRGPAGRITLWNKGAELLYGWSREEAMGQIADELRKTEFPEPLGAILSELAKSGRWSGELRHHTKDGRVLSIQSWWLAERDPAGRVLEILESNVDVTEHRRFQQELEKLVAERTARLQETIADLEHFSYTITHDMRAPLRAMQAFGQILEMEYRDRLDHLGQDYLRRIIDSSQRMDHLITDALSYAKVVRQELALTPVDTEALLKGMVNSYPEFQLPKADVQIQPGIPWVLGNKAGLTQCFSNLLANAVKFMKPGTHPKVRVWGEQIGSAVRLWFEDNGIGITPEGQKKIFTMFQRLSREHEGTGIGLALVQKVVERMHGKVGVESQPGQGSRFWLELHTVDVLQAPCRTEG